MCHRRGLFPLLVLCALAIGRPSLLLADTYQEVTVTVGETFTVDLDSNPSMGYEWVLAGSLPDWLTWVDHGYFPTDPGTIGGGGTETWTFRATGSGNTTLTFEYMRPWEGIPIQVHLCQVTAEPPTDTETIDVLVGEAFTVSLDSNPSAGYEWVLAEALPDWLELADKTYVAADPGMIGEGGTEHWTFRATAVGSTTLTFEYMQPWEGTPIKVHVCQVTARRQEPDKDGFETGDFSVLAWEHPDIPWRVTSTRTFSGIYSACSGVIGDDGISTLTYTRDCREGQIGFAVRVSSEPAYDCLYFRIDGQEIAVWSGEQAWTQVSYPVSKGNHTFVWSYVKDKSKSLGEDTAWIDEVTLPAVLEPNGPGGIVLAKIPAGSFQMGDHDGSGATDERPVHTVTLNAFQMSKYETTNAQYAAFLNGAMDHGLIQVVNGVVYASTDESRVQPYCDIHSTHIYSQIDYGQGRFSAISRDGTDMSDHPMVQVSWYGAKAFCDYYGYRLPTEAEWEYAARGGYQDPCCPYPWGGNAIDCTKANHFDGNAYCNPLGLPSPPYTSPVGFYGPQGAFGLCDMAGNAWECCQDWYDSAYYSSSPGTNPQGPTTGMARVCRGGSWTEDGSTCRVANRYWHAPTSRTWGGGFRPCR